MFFVLTSSVSHTILPQKIHPQNLCFSFVPWWALITESKLLVPRWALVRNAKRRDSKETCQRYLKKWCIELLGCKCDEVSPKNDEVMKLYLMKRQSDWRKHDVWSNVWNDPNDGGIHRNYRSWIRFQSNHLYMYYQICIHVYLNIHVFLLLLLAPPFQNGPASN